MSAVGNFNNHLVGITTRYLAGRNAIQTCYWRAGYGGKLIKYSKICEFSRLQDVPASIRHQYVNRSFLTHNKTG